MKKLIYFLSAIAFCVLMPACGSNGGHDEHEGHEAHNHEEHDGGTHEEHDEGAIVLEPKRAEDLGVEAEVVTAGNFAEVLKVAGQVVPSPSDNSIVSAKSSGIVTYAAGISEGSKVSVGSRIATVTAKGIAGGDSNEAAKTALQAAKRELDRVTPLAADGIVSKKDYNAALQAYEQAKAAYSGSESGSAAISAQRGVVTALLVKQGEYVEAGTPIAEISGSDRLTLRADVPEKQYGFIPRLTSANFRTGSSENTFSLPALDGKRVAEGALSSANSGYIPVYFTFKNNGEVVPGSFAEVYLLGNSREGVLTVPLASLYEQQGQKFVFVRLDEDCYDKRPVVLGGDDGERVEVVSGLKDGEMVVTKGVTFVRLAESAGAVPEGHSHHHH